MQRFLSELERLYEFDRWANHETLASLRNARAGSGRAVKMMAHIVATLMLWHDRVSSREPRVPVWPEWDLEEISKRLPPALHEWARLIEFLSDGEIDRMVAYTNSKGEQFTSPLRDIVIHVAMHGVHHRGQIAAELSRAGETPAYTDFIHASRTGALSGDR